MTPRRALTIAAAVSVGVALGSIPAGAVAAAPSVIGGTLEPAAAQLPKSPKLGRAQVLAMNIDTGAYGDTSRVGGNGRYSLRLPAGKWALLSSVVSLGKPARRFLSAAISTRPGERRTLPLTLKQFKKPRKKKRKKKHRHPPKHRAQASNVNPSDGRPYAGEAIAVKFFDVLGGSEVQSLRKGLPDMLITDLVSSPGCEFTLVEWEYRELIKKEIAFNQSEYVDPATRVEPGHVIEPELFLNGRVEERPGTPKRIALVAWLEDAKTGARIPGEVSVVELYGAFFLAQERLVKLILRDLICPRANRPPPAAGGETAGPPAPPPKPVANTYVGTFSGTGDAAGPMHFEWNGTVHMDAAQDSSMPPAGAPPGEYRLFTTSQGGMNVSTTAGDAKCGWTGSGHVDLTPGFQGGVLWVQLDTPTPAYFLSIRETKFIEVTKTGTECSGTDEVPIPEPWALTESAHTSSSTVLNDSEAHITPEIGYDWDYTTSWNLAPG